ncbi:MAG TPA: GAF domain-containing protein, partial [Nitrospirae bacterium]|nr:GAF domain-containing protein [Nitrospirota bacterium]
MRDANIRHTLGSINRRIKLASLISLLIIYSLVLVIARLLYVSIAYIPMSSIVAILAIIAGLVALSTFFVRKSLKYAVSRIEDFSEKIVSISRISRDISEIVHSDLLLNKIIDICLELTGADAGSIFLAEGDNLVLKAVRGGAGEKLTGLSIPKSQGIAGWVAANGETVRVDDVSVDSRFSPEVDERSGYKTVSLLCVPLRLSSGTIGVLELINKKNGVFINEDEAIALYLADQVSITIDRDRFYEDQKNYEIHLTSILLNVMDTLYLEKRGHAKRVAKYTLVMAQAMNMSEDQKKLLYRASLLHDIGMLRVDPETISSKEDYKAHSQIGYEMLYPINFYADIAPIILYHHE